MNDFSMLPPDIILAHILPHLDGETLISLSSVSSKFFHLICKNNNEDLWRNICISTWPSLLSNGPIILSGIISMFPGGYRSFFSDAFSSIHHRNTPPPPRPPPRAYFKYAIDIFLQGEQEREPLYTHIEYQHIDIKTWPDPGCWWISTVGSDAYFELHACNWIDSNLNFIRVKKDGCEEYLKEKLRLSCVLISCRYGLTPSSTDRAWGLFSSRCNPVVSVTTDKRWVEAVYETVMPGLRKTVMVKFEAKVMCCWDGGEEDRFYVKCIKFRMEDMNGKHLKEEYGAQVLLNAIENGERKKK